MEKIISVVVSSVVSFVVAYLTVRNERKKMFNELITKERLNYLHELRDLIAQFCECALIKRPSCKTDLQALSVKIKLRMNPKSDYGVKWDKNAMELIEKIVKNFGMDDETNLVGELIELMQSWFDLEWKGITAEGREGVLSPLKKAKLNLEVYNRYLSK